MAIAVTDNPLVFVQAAKILQDLVSLNIPKDGVGEDWKELRSIAERAEEWCEIHAPIDREEK